MKKILTLFTYCAFFTTSIYAQKLEVTYQEITKLNVEEFKNASTIQVNGSSTLPKELYDNMMKSAQEPKDFILKIYNNETNYKKIEKLDNQQTSGIKMTISFGGAGGDLFKNLSTKEYTKSIHLMDKSYIIKDKLNDYNWKISRESKKIIGFDVKKATAVIDSTKSIVAWFAPSIAVKDGPGMYNGLPGLILELEIKDSKNKSVESMTIRATDVKEVPEMKPFEKPKDKNVITEKEFEELTKKQMERFKQMRSEGIDKKD